MAGMFQESLRSTNSEYLRNYAHASKIFRSNAYANSPKYKWLFHVYFEVNDTLISSNPGLFPDPSLPGLLVKNINLPKFSIATAEMNQYNRKRYVQTKVSYDPVMVTFHDDNAGTIRNMWYNYFSYYYNDPNQPLDQNTGQTLDPGNSISLMNQRTTYSPDISQNANWGYRGEIANSPTAIAMGVPKAPFFKSIKVYGFNQHNFTLYELINPIIERFDHDTYDYYQTTAMMENKMTIKYETVKYQQGSLNGQTPGEVVAGFGNSNYYDTQLSPIAIPGSNSYAIGQSGMVNPGAGIISDLSTNTIIGGAQVGGNPSLFTSITSGILGGVVNSILNPGSVRNTFNFPTTSSASGVTAQQITNNQVIQPINTQVSNIPPVATA